MGGVTLKVSGINFLARLWIVIFFLLCFLAESPATSFANEIQSASEDSGTKNSVSSHALDLALAGQEKEAHALLLSAYASSPGKEDPEVPYFLAALESKNDNFKLAIRYLKEAKEIVEKSETSDNYQNMLVLKRLGDCRYGDNDEKTALVDYKSAFMLAELIQGEPSVVREEILESIVACMTNSKDYAEAEKYGTMLVRSTKARCQKDPLAVFSLVWAHLQLSDVYRLSNQPEKLTELRTELRPLLRSLIELRMSTEQSGAAPTYEALIDMFRRKYIAELHPRTPAALAWAACDFRERSMPIIGWGNWKEAQAAIVCIHGLGLENRAFHYTATELNKRGYVVYALDVRGFGSWTQTRGMEEIDYDQAIADIRLLCEALKSDSENLKVFVLGESMGGAIALRAAASLGGVIDGVISSVPSAERFQQKKMTLQTALHFIKDPHKAFDVDYVAAMATSNADMQSKWKKDPKAKLQLSPIELMEFAVFMRRTKPQVEKITDLPVLIVQGLGDRLVKPEGTFSLFDAVSSKDKTLHLAGLAEHLMFETVSPDPILIDTVDSWLKHHISP